MPKPSPPPDDKSLPWNISNVIYTVGLPVKKAPDPTGARYGDQIHEWKTVYGIDTNVTAKISRELYKKWLELTNRILLNEVDNAFGTSLGMSDQVEFAYGPQYIWLNPRKTQFSDLEKFIGNFEFKLGRKKIVFEKDNPRWVICFIGRSEQIGGLANFPVEKRYSNFFMTLDDNKEREIEIDSGSEGGWKITPCKLPKKIRANLRGLTTLAHELGHILSLGDEYPGNEGKRLPDSMMPAVAGRGNIQAAKTLLDSSCQLDARKIKWNWARLVKAGVIEQSGLKISDESEFWISLEAGHADQFLEGDLVCLRLASPLMKPEYPSFYPMSAPLKIKKVDRKGNKIFVHRNGTIALETIGGFYDKGDRVVVAKRETDSSDSKILSQIAPVIFQHLARFPPTFDCPGWVSRPIKVCKERKAGERAKI